MVIAATLEPRLRRELAAIVGADHVLDDPAVTDSFVHEWTGRVHGATSAVVRPASTGEVAAVLRACSGGGVAVVPQGGNTGLVAGGIALDGAITLSLTRLAQLEQVDEVAAQITAGAGVTLASLRAAARAAGLDFAVDLAARDSATVGGMVATNAGGLHVVRYGPMRAQLVGVEAVRSNGELIGDLRGLVKDNTGYHWPSVLCGSEGTLAVVTRVRLALVPRPTDHAVALVGFANAHDAVRAAARLRRVLPDLHAIELVTAHGVGLVCDTLAIAPPFAPMPPIALLVEAASERGDVVDALAAAVAALDGVLDALVALEPERRAALWRYREAHTECIATLGPVHKLDVTLPLAGLAAFMDEVRALVARLRPEATVWLFGHAGDGNVHVNITGVAPDDEAIDGEVLALVAARGGSISAEHGIGRAKLAFLHLNRSDTDIAAMRAIKQALDPPGILNPGVLIPSAASR